MAPITWRNINAPDFSPSSRMMQAAADSWSSGLGNISDALNRGADIARRKASADATSILAGVKSEADVDAALAKISETIQPYNMTPELQAAMMNLRGTAMGYDASRAAQARAASRGSGGGSGTATGQVDPDRLATAAAVLGIDPSTVAGAPATASDAAPTPAPTTPAAPAVLPSQVAQDFAAGSLSIPGARPSAPQAAPQPVAPTAATRVADLPASRLLAAAQDGTGLVGPRVENASVADQLLAQYGNETVPAPAPLGIPEAIPSVAPAAQTVQPIQPVQSPASASPLAIPQAFDANSVQPVVTDQALAGLYATRGITGNQLLDGVIDVEKARNDAVSNGIESQRAQIEYYEFRKGVDDAADAEARDNVSSQILNNVIQSGQFDNPTDVQRAIRANPELQADPELMNAVIGKVDGWFENNPDYFGLNGDTARTESYRDLQATQNETTMLLRTMMMQSPEMQAYASMSAQLGNDALMENALYGGDVIPKDLPPVLDQVSGWLSPPNADGTGGLGLAGNAGDISENIGALAKELKMPPEVLAHLARKNSTFTDLPFYKGGGPIFGDSRAVELDYDRLREVALPISESINGPNAKLYAQVMDDWQSLSDINYDMGEVEKDLDNLSANGRTDTQAYRDGQAKLGKLQERAIALQDTIQGRLQKPEETQTPEGSTPGATVGQTIAGAVPRVDRISSIINQAVQSQNADEQLKQAVVDLGQNAVEQFRTTTQATDMDYRIQNLINGQAPVSPDFINNLVNNFLPSDRVQERTARRELNIAAQDWVRTPEARQLLARPGMLQEATQDLVAFYQKYGAR